MQGEPGEKEDPEADDSKAEIVKQAKAISGSGSGFRCYNPCSFSLMKIVSMLSKRFAAISARTKATGLLRTN